MTLISAAGLVKRFGSVTALDGLSVSIPSGCITALLGPNGAGKTTFIRTVATLVRPSSGAVSVLGHDAVREARSIRRLIGLAGQSAAVDPVLTGTENLVMVARLYGCSRSVSRSRASQVLASLGLTAIADRPVKTYSGGERRRVDLGASLVGSPRLLLLDEPTTGLDPRSRIELWETIRALAANGTEVLLSTQYLDEADQLAANIVIIDSGRVVAEGTPSSLKARAGADRIEVRLADGSGLPLASEVLSSVCSVDASVEPAALRVSVAAPAGASLLSAVAVGLERAEVAVEDLTLRRPTLDEVFMALTGRAKDAEEAA